MALLHVNFFSNSIGQMAEMNVILPENFKGKLPVFYLLHGLSDDHTAWQRRTSIERYVDGQPLVVVMPCTDRGWYTNAANWPQLRYEDHIIKDVMGFVERTFPVKKERDGRAIGGLSMGGYGAVKLGLKYPQLFCSINSHSGALRGPHWHDINEVGQATKDLSNEFMPIFGKETFGSSNDPAALVDNCPKNKRPKILIDCGKQDFLIEDNRFFHKHLLKNKYAHTYREFPGDHNWGYWDLHIQEALVFHRENLGIK